MACSNVGAICDNIIFSDAVTFTAPNLIINIPAGSYANGKKYCIVIAQEIPVTTTIAANVVISIGGDTATLYPLVNCNCTNVTACQLSTRTRYATKVRTNIQSGVFQLLGKINCNTCSCANKNAAPALPIPAEAAPAVNAEVVSIPTANVVNYTTPIMDTFNVPNINNVKGGETD